MHAIFFLSGSNRPVDSPPEINSHQRIGPHSAQAGKGIRGPGPGCGLGAEEASRASARAGRGLYWAAGNQLGRERWRARVKQAMGRISLGRAHCCWIGPKWQNK